jgi:hypothetical protein
MQSADPDEPSTIDQGAPARVRVTSDAWHVFSLGLALGGWFIVMALNVWVMLGLIVILMWFDSVPHRWFQTRLAIDGRAVEVERRWLLLRRRHRFTLDDIVALEVQSFSTRLVATLRNGQRVVLARGNVTLEDAFPRAPKVDTHPQAPWCDALREVKATVEQLAPETRRDRDRLQAR